MGFIPIFTTFFGWLLLGQKPTLVTLLGILIICLSIYILRMKKGGDFLDPIKLIFTSSAAKAMAIIGIVTGIAAIGDKVAIDKSSALVYMALNLTGAFLVLVVCDFIFFHQESLTKKTRSKLSQKNILLIFVLMSSFYVLSQFLSFVAIEQAPVTSYAVAVRNLNIVVASLVAIFLFNEKLTKYKTVSYVFSAIGVLLFAF